MKLCRSVEFYRVIEFVFASGTKQSLHLLQCNRKGYCMGRSLFHALSASYLSNCNSILQKSTNLLGKDTQACRRGDIGQSSSWECLVAACFPSKWAEISALDQNSGRLSAIVGISNSGIARFKKKKTNHKQQSILLYCDEIRGNRLRECTFESPM